MSSLIRRIVRRVKRVRLPRAPSARPPLSAIMIALIAVSIFILGGGVYNLLMKPLVLLPAPGFPIFYHYGLHEQTWNESLVAIFLFVIGVIGGFLSYRSTRYAYNPRQAAILLLIGVVMLILAFIGCEYVLALK